MVHMFQRQMVSLKPPMKEDHLPVKADKPNLDRGAAQPHAASPSSVEAVPQIHSNRK